MVFTSGKNNASFRISKNDFLKLIESAVKLNKFSLIDKEDLL